MSRYGQLSEKDELIKSLRSKANKTDSKIIKTAIETKLDIIEGNKTIEK